MYMCTTCMQFPWRPEEGVGVGYALACSLLSLALPVGDVALANVVLSEYFDTTHFMLAKLGRGKR